MSLGLCWWLLSFKPIADMCERVASSDFSKKTTRLNI